MKTVIESIKTLSHLATQIELYLTLSRVTYTNRHHLNLLMPLPDFFASQQYSQMVLSVMMSDVKVFASSYLDELNGELTPSNYPEKKEEILAFRQAIKPALKRIGKWTHLKDVRNELLVHNYKVKNTSIFSANHKAKTYNAPFKDQEVLLLGELILLINKQFILFFPEEVKNMLAQDERITDLYKAVDNPIDFREEIAAITHEVEANISARFPVK